MFAKTFTGSSAVSGQRANSRGFTVIELLVSFTIFGILSAIVMSTFTNYKDKAQVARAIEDLRTLSTAITIYEMTNDGLPENLTDMPQGDMLDPWGRPYQYYDIQGASKGKGKGAEKGKGVGSGEPRKDRFLVPLNSDYDLYSMGKDGKTVAPLTAAPSWDDVIRANDGAYLGLASNY